MKQLKKITFELSFKPFKSTEPDYIEKKAREVFRHWSMLCSHADEIGIMFFLSDGSEILEYKGEHDQTLEWGKYIGCANRSQKHSERDPKDLALNHSKPYMKNPPVMTYGTIRLIVDTFKRVGKEMTGKPIVLIETFDPGPEFADSAFKYHLHNEVCVTSITGFQDFVCCYGVLNEDHEKYAAYPDGIPDKTKFGTFFGRQCQAFLTDMGFDKIWFSNGFGFGSAAWNEDGVLFDGENFHPEEWEKESLTVEFWRLFREECNFPVETRGTNLTTGIDYAKDAVNYDVLYQTADFLPPPNSPWAALDRDYGLEIAGYLSRIAELPQACREYMFRFYVHDPWYLNSPWIDRYEGYAHDIYLPVSTARISDDGSVQLPDHINFLTIDDSLGNMPERCPLEVTATLLSALEHAPDKYAPFIWLYPFEEYCKDKTNLEKILFEDWFMVNAINNGLPISMIVSTGNFIKLQKENPRTFINSILVCPVSLAESDVNDELLKFTENGGKVILYGNVHQASASMRDAIGVSLHEPLTGEFACGENGEKIYYRKLSDGGLSAVADSAVSLLDAGQNQESRALITIKGNILWCRGQNRARGKLREKDTTLSAYLRRFLPKLGYRIDFTPAENALQIPTWSRYCEYSAVGPVITISHSKDSLWYSGYTPDTTVSITLNTPIGAPLLIGNEGISGENGVTYHTPRGWQQEVRVFLLQDSRSVVRCMEETHELHGTVRSLCVMGLQNATVRYLVKDGDPGQVLFSANMDWPYYGNQEELEYEFKESVFGKIVEIKNVTGYMRFYDRGITLGDEE